MWFSMLFPLVPKGVAGWTFAAGLGVVATAWAGGSITAILWLNKQTERRLLCNSVGFVVAVSLGVGIFALALYRQDLVFAYFSYY